MNLKKEFQIFILSLLIINTHSTIARSHTHQDNTEARYIKRGFLVGFISLFSIKCFYVAEEFVLHIDYSEKWKRIFMTERPSSALTAAIKECATKSARASLQTALLGGIGCAFAGCTLHSIQKLLDRFYNRNKISSQNN